MGAIDDAVTRVRAARTDPTLAVLEGAHALKHALRFGAAVAAAYTPDLRALTALLSTVAPDVRDTVARLAAEVDADVWAELAPRGLPSPALAIAPRPATTPADVLAPVEPAPVVLLEEPTHAGNVGAAVRVAAAAGAAGVLTVGGVDPWAPAALRGAAGLQYAVPTARCDDLDAVTNGGRPIVAVDPEGTSLEAASLPDRAILAFGTERAGLSDELRARATVRVRIPMRPGVSSLNLATAVAVVLYAWSPAAGRQ